MKKIEWFSIDDVAFVCGVTRAKVLRWLRDDPTFATLARRLPSRRGVVIDASAFKLWLGSKGIEARPAPASARRIGRVWADKRGHWVWRAVVNGEVILRSTRTRDADEARPVARRLEEEAVLEREERLRRWREQS